MERQWSGNARRLSHADRAKIETPHLGRRDIRSGGGGGGLLDEVDPAVSCRSRAG